MLYWDQVAQLTIQRKSDGKVFFKSETDYDEFSEDELETVYTIERHFGAVNRVSFNGIYNNIIWLQEHIDEDSMDEFWLRLRILNWFCTTGTSFGGKRFEEYDKRTIGTYIDMLVKTVDTLKIAAPSLFQMPALLREYKESDYLSVFYYPEENEEAKAARFRLSQIFGFMDRERYIKVCNKIEEIADLFNNNVVKDVFVSHLRLLSYLSEYQKMFYYLDKEKAKEYVKMLFFVIDSDKFIEIVNQ